MFLKLKQPIILLFVTLLTFGSLIFLNPSELPVAHADNTATSTFQMISTAYDDVYKKVSAEGEGEDILEQNLEAILQARVGASGPISFGNVGILLGPKSKDAYDSYQSPLSLDISQIKYLDERSGSTSASEYQKFGIAVHKLKQQGEENSDKMDTDISGSLDSISAAAGKLTNMGTVLLKRFSPAPLLLAFIWPGELDNPTYGANELMQIIHNNDTAYNIVKTFGGPSTIMPSVSFSFVIVVIMIMLLLVTSVLMTLFNGRAAGENIRKAIFKIVVVAVGIPLLAKGLVLGVDFLHDFTTDDVNYEAISTAEQHLNFADWVATGFALPHNLRVTINDNGSFQFTRDNIREINLFTYRWVTGETADVDKVASRLKAVASQNNNQTSTAFVPATSRRWFSTTPDTWDSKGVSSAAEALSANSDATLVSDDTDFQQNKYFRNFTLDINLATSEMIGAGNGISRYGISPIAVTNLFRTEFSSTKMTVVPTDDVKIPTVVYYADRLAYLAPDAPSPEMNSLTRFIATMTMTVAAMTGLFSVLAAGFGGVLQGGAKTAFGNTHGLGQAVGGAVALLGGVMGIGLIMVISLNLLDAIYGIIVSMFSISSLLADDSILAPLTEAVSSIPFGIGKLLEGMLVTMAALIVNVAAMFILPKFGGVPIKMFCHYLSEIPGRFAEKAQQMENRFTGDFRGGGGGGRGIGANALQQAAEGGKAQLAAVSAGAGAIGGFALSKVGGSILNKVGGGDEGDNNEGDVHGGDNSNNEVINDDNDTINDNDMADAQVNDADANMADTPIADDIDSASVENASDDSMDATDAMGTSDMANLGSDAMTANAENRTGSEASIGGDTNEMNENQEVNEGENSINEGSDGEKTINEGSDTAFEGNEDSLQTDTANIDSTLAQATTSSEALMNSESTQDIEANSSESMASETDSNTQNNADVSSMVNKTTDGSAIGSDKSVSGNTSKVNSTDKKQGSAATSKNGSISGKANGATDNTKKQSMNASRGKNNGNTVKSGTTATGAQRAQTRTLSKGQKLARALGKGMQAAGGNATKGQAAAGALHMAGGVLGVQNTTEKVLRTTTQNAQRQRDMKDGLGSRYSQNAMPTGRPKATEKAATNKAVAQSADNAQRNYQDALEYEERLRAQEDK